ncbi:MAG: hypothetical protein QF535_08095, partial [Anaerolineales bacterium]|nr:hypothetical protein [Anaerolineales bacterium]
GGTASSNTDGTISSSVSANTDAGFSIVSYTGDDTAGSTVGHGLSVTPELLIWKNLDITENFGVFNSYVCTVNSADRLYLNTNNALVTSGEDRIDALSSSVVTFGSNNSEINNTDDFIMYCFHSVDGYSKVGSYEGNNNADGSFIYLGFKPAMVVIKEIDATRDWVMFDNKRNPYNEVTTVLKPNDHSAEGTARNLDFLSNGIKMRESSAYINDALTYIYIAFAESPFKTSNAR